MHVVLPNCPSEKLCELPFLEQLFTDFKEPIYFGIFLFKKQPRALAPLSMAIHTSREPQGSPWLNSRNDWVKCTIII